MRRNENELEQKVMQTIKEYNLIQPNDKILVCVSGGPDSMCLIDILYCLKEKLGIQLVVAHVNHMIRKEAEEETKYVEEYCKNKDIPCFIKYVDVEKMAKEKKLGTEEMGRIVRYDFFEEIAQKEMANKIATAHNANDNAETVLMNLLRGSSPSGLKGIEIARDAIKNETNIEQYKNKNYQSLNNDVNNNCMKITYIRPLRECERQEIESYCKRANLNPKIDKSNFENIYTRNKVRNELIPYLQKEYNPNIIQTLNRLSDLAKEDEEYFKKIVAQEYENLKIEENNKMLAKDINKDKENTREVKNKKSNKCIKKEIILDLKKFNKLDKVIKSKLILYTINKTIETTQGIQKVNIEDIIKLCENNIGNKFLTPNKNIKIFVKSGKIYFTYTCN